MKFLSYSLAAIAGSLIAGSVLAQGGTPAAQPTVKPAVAGETAKIEAKSQDNAPIVKADVSKSETAAHEAVKGEATKIVKKHKHAEGDASPKQVGGTAPATDAKYETKKESTAGTPATVSGK